MQTANNNKAKFNLGVIEKCINSNFEPALKRMQGILAFVLIVTSTYRNVCNNIEFSLCFQILNMLLL